ncbi:hypothetical protein JCM3775_007123 [Rhodotorula graminis]|uniref:PLAC8-domain-containing protein n=1 Tax=Rhodotorula graminis (strain WP1) TaxID=578459 RepID=A0A0P9EV06_RHOGW|nr:uncharacterized protein RHOBADRAFT_46054 [Rhodotorula graminis WP1]KPV72960.1 hypothetical protein RHOBADRAFT_46054 [Rhodotorula graminis WP1]
MNNPAPEKPALAQQQYQQPQAPVYEQPHGAAPMAVHGAPPAHNAAQPGHERPWSTGLCECGNDVPGFCLSCWCPCMAYGQYKERYDHLAQTGRPKPKEQVESCGTPGVLYLVVHCLTGFGFVLDFMARGDIRNRYGIKGGALGDCCTACCCMPCTQRQHHRELAIEEVQQWGAVPQMGAQQSQSQMYPPAPAHV